MNVFELARANVSARAAAEYYGIKVRRNGMACCPFHPDKHPSMKLDQRFHCFGCQADGDAVNLTAGLFGLSNYDAAVKLLDDFGIDHPENKYSSAERKSEKTRAEQKQTERQQRLIKVEKQFRNWLSYAEDTLLKYQHLLNLWKERYAPQWKMLSGILCLKRLCRCRLSMNITSIFSFTEVTKNVWIFSSGEGGGEKACRTNSRI